MIFIALYWKVWFVGSGFLQIELHITLWQI